jgi:hypothetical protein
MRNKSLFMIQKMRSWGLKTLHSYKIGSRSLQLRPNLHNLKLDLLKLLQGIVTKICKLDWNLLLKLYSEQLNFKFILKVNHFHIEKVIRHLWQMVKTFYSLTLAVR